MQTEKCYYCGGDAGDETEYYVHTMYYIHERMKLWVGYNYSTKKVRVPRCKTWRSKHESFGRIWSSLLFLGIFGFLFWKLYEVDRSFWVSLLGAGFMSLLATGLIFWFAEQVFFEKTKGIPPADDIDRYPIVNEMLKAGWIKSRPDPASHPETGEEKRKAESKQPE